MVDGSQKSGIWDSMQDREDFDLCTVNPKRSGTGNGELNASEVGINR